MDPLLHRPEAGANRVAWLDAFLQNFADDNNDEGAIKNAPTALTTPAAIASTPAAQATTAAATDGTIAAGISYVATDGTTDKSRDEATAAATGGVTDGTTDRSGAAGVATAVTAVAGAGADEVEDNIRAVMSGAVSFGGDSPKHGGGREAAAQAEVLRVLDFLFCSDRALVESTIQVLDKSRVVNVRARESGRGVWLVQGSRGAPYLCLEGYCSCRSFLELARRGGGHPVLCKHLLAVRLAPALGVSRLEEVDDDKLAQRISACDYG